MMKGLAWAAVSLALCACTTPQISHRGTKFLAEPTVVADDGGNHLAAAGYLKLTLTSSQDLQPIAARYGTSPSFEAEECDSHRKVGVWSKLYRSDPNTYTALLAYKDKAPSTYNLAQRPTDVCFTVHIGSMAPFLDFRSEPIRLRLSEELLQVMRAYDSDNGAVTIQLGETCRRWLCQPSPYLRQRTDVQPPALPASQQ